MLILNRSSTRPARSTARDGKPRKSRAWRFIFITLGSGGLAALMALAIAGVPTVLSRALPGDTPPQIDASAVFPPAPPVHKVVDVYDPPPKQAPQPRPVAAGQAPTSRPVSPFPSPRPTDPPDD